MGIYKGYKQTAEHVNKRLRYGDKHHAWMGDDITVRSGRSRALRKYPEAKPCQKCGKDNVRIHRHHKDGNTLNNDEENIIFLCGRCHMEIDGRLDKFKELAKNNFSKMSAASIEQKKSITHCPKGHPYSGDNLYVNPRGARCCRKCINDYKRNKRATGKNGS